MITVKDFAIRQAKDGREFIVHILQDGLSLVQSRETVTWFAAIKQSTVPSAFDKATAKSMISERIPGSVQKNACEPYEFTSKTTGEIRQ